MQGLRCSFLEKVGHTPLVEMNVSGIPGVNFYAKLEFQNPTGSMKDRSASYIIEKSLENGLINENATLIESSSGNFGISLAAYCRKYGLKFCCVVDPNISTTNEFLIRSLGARVVKVKDLDRNGGYLLSRLEKVNELLQEIPNSYWVNQYANPYSAEAYQKTLARELCSSLEKIDYVFIGVGSGGTITGVSVGVKEAFPEAKIIAVDTVGSVIFGGFPAKRRIPGIGSSIVPDLLRQAKVDDVVMVEESEAIIACRELLSEQGLFVGGSSGSVYSAAKEYFSEKSFGTRLNAVVIFADRGERYMDTVYNDVWVEEFFGPILK